MNWVENYKKERPKYEKFTSKLERLLEELLKAEDIGYYNIESRTKSVKSFEKKVQIKNYDNPLNDMTDFTGIRIILRSLSDVEKVSKLIENEFKINKEKSVNKAKQLNPDQFNYLSQHFIVQINESRSCLKEWEDFKEVWAEIQVRTILQHAWANISHFLDYKNEVDIPYELKRKLYSMSAVLEVADENLNILIHNIQELSDYYKQKIDLNQLDIDINSNSLIAYFEISKTAKYWEKILKNLGIDLPQFIDVSYAIEILNKMNVTTIQELDDLLKGSKSWGEESLKKYLIPDEVPLDDKNISFIFMENFIEFMLVANYPEKFNKKNINPNLIRKEILENTRD